MSYLKPNLSGVYDIPSLNASNQLYIKGKRFEDYINELVFEDQLEQSEINEIKLLLEYLDTTGLNSAWTVTNSNVNETLRSAILALQTKLANIDTTALTQSSVLTNDNRNSVLKTRIDTAESDIDGVETKTRFITEASVTGTGNNTYSNYRTRVGPADGVEKGSALIELNMKNGPANELIGYTIKSNFNNDSYSDNESIYSHRDGRLTLLAHTMRMQATEQIRIGNFAQYGDGGASTAINIGGRGQHVNIGCIDALSTGTTSTQIQIGKQSDTAPNTSTRLSGNMYLSDARFEDLHKSTPFTLASVVALMSSGPPSWVLGFFSGATSFPYSDVWCMKGGFAGNKNGDVETRNAIMLEELYVVNKSVLNITPKVGFFLAKADYSCTQLIGDHRTQVFEGEIMLRNNNITSSSVDWALTGANDKCNVVNIGGDSGILIHQGASDTGAPLRIINSCAGNIELELGDGGTQASIGGALTGGNGMSIRSIPLTDLQGNSYTGGMVRMGYYFGGNTQVNPFWGTYQLEVNQYPNRQGIIIAKTIFGENFNHTFKKNIINGDSINTEGTITGIDLVGTTSISAPTATATSLVINGNYTGNTDARLYKNADNKLMWNGSEVGAGGVSSGGITYMINVASNITNPSPTPTETIITAAYSGNPQRTITQAINSNSAFYIAKYTTEVFDEATNPVLTGLQQLNQYISWNTQAHTGQLYGQLWFQATAVGSATLYQRTYASPVTTTAATFINGTPIPTPKGLYNIKFQRVVFPNINVVVTSGPVVLRYRVEGLVSGSWTSLYTMVGLAPPTVSSTTSNLTITLDESVILNQTTPGATAVRLVLYISGGTGTISQTSAGGADLAAYSLIGLGVNTPGLFRTMLYDGTNAKITIPYSTTPTLVEYDLAIDAPYNVSAFASPTLSTDLYFIQPAGGFANHAITLYFNEGSISHYHSTISPPQTTPTLAQVLNSGATASQPINMNTNKISGITTLEGSSNGNWNVKEITAAQGSGISVTPTNGSYAIANSGVLSVAAASGTPGITATTTNGAVTLQNSGIISITAGTGISVSTTNGVAQITNTGSGITTASVLENIRDEHQSLYEVGALPRKPDYWATNWTLSDSTVRAHRDIYVSVDGKIIASATGMAETGVRYSTNYGSTWNDGNQFSTTLEFSSICGTSNGSKLFTFATEGNGYTGLLLNFYSSTSQGLNWTRITSSVFEFQNAAGITRVNRVRCSGDGKYILANISNVGTNGRSLFSSDGGATWVVKNISAGLPSGFTNGVAMSRSGAVQFITWISDTGTTNSGIFRSMDYGATWAQVQGHIAGANFTHIECDATGRFVYATRYVNISTPVVETYRSDNYGMNWIPAGINGIEDIWVSGTGQFVAGVSNPQGGGVSYVVYSTDYGRSFTGVNMTITTGSGTTYRTINGNADGSILVLGSVNSTEGGFAGDGKIRIARSGSQNIYDILQDYKTLWYTVNLKSTNALSFITFPINATYGDINFDTHNIEYEIEINWDRHTSLSPSAHIRMGVNGIDSEGNIHSANTTWVLRLEQAYATIHGGNQGAIGYDQHYNNRFYCGYSAGQGTGDQYRYRTLLTGQLGVQRRKQAQTVDLGGYSADWSLDTRTLTNRFTSDTYILQVTQFSTNGPDRARLYTQSDFDDGHHLVTGTAIWELTDAGAWESGLGGAQTALKDGIKNIKISFVNNTTLAAINRSFDISARFWRVRK